MNAGVEEINLAEVKELPVQIGVPFTNKWEISCRLESRQSVIDAYNTLMVLISACFRPMPMWLPKLRFFIVE